MVKCRENKERKQEISGEKERRKRKRKKKKENTFV